MNNFKIYNEADAPEATIEILGDIGESWFDEGVTVQSVNEQLKSLKGKPINVKVSSLGGDLFHALAIHNILRMHDQPVKSQIIGATASAGTVIAMAGTQREIAANSLFLIHNAQTFAMGNYADMQKAAEDLAKFDGVLASLYNRATGKTRPEILALMEQERWLTAEEAKEWGFVNAVIDMPVIMNDYRIKQFNELYNVKPLIINNMATDKNPVINEMTEEEKQELENLRAKCKDLEAKLAEYEEEKAKNQEEMEEKEADEEVENYVRKGVITNDLKAHFVKMYRNDKESTKTILAGLPEPTERLKDKVNNGTSTPGAKITHKEYMANMKSGVYAKNPEQQKRDFETVYGKL